MKLHQKAKFGILLQTTLQRAMIPGSLPLHKHSAWIITTVFQTNKNYHTLNYKTYCEDNSRKFSAVIIGLTSRPAGVLAFNRSVRNNKKIQVRQRQRVNGCYILTPLRLCKRQVKAGTPVILHIVSHQCGRFTIVQISLGTVNIDTWLCKTRLTSERRYLHVRHITIYRNTGQIFPHSISILSMSSSL